MSLDLKHKLPPGKVRRYLRDQGYRLTSYPWNIVESCYREYPTGLGASRWLAHAINADGKQVVLNVYVAFSVGKKIISCGIEVMSPGTTKTEVEV